MCIKPKLYTHTSPVSAMASTEEEVSDYDVMDFPIFLTKVSIYIDFRIKIHLKTSQIFYPGEEKIIPTRLMISAMPAHMNFHIKEESRLPLMLKSEGSISPMFRGRLHLNLFNSNNSVVHLNTTVTVAYIIIQVNL